MHHNDAPNLDPRTDITDLFVFQKPGDPTKSILILNVNPEAPARAHTFDSQASYELKIDTNGDFEAEIAFHVLFTTLDDGQQAATRYRATDATARGIGPVGEAIIQHAPVSFTPEARITTEGQYRFYAGLRSEPFFADPIGFQNNMQWTGRDFWAGKNVFGIVLEVPNSELGPNPKISIWGANHDTDAGHTDFSQPNGPSWEQCLSAGSRHQRHPTSATAGALLFSICSHVRDVWLR